MVVGEQMAAEESGDQSVESRIVERHNVLAAPPSWGSDIGIGLLPTNDFLSFFCSPSSIPMTTWHHTSRNSPPARSSTNTKESSGLVQHVIISPNLACPHRTRPCRWLVTIPSTVGTTDAQQQAAASSSRPPASYWAGITRMAPVLSVKPQIAVKKGREEKELFLSVLLFLSVPVREAARPPPGVTQRHARTRSGTQLFLRHRLLHSLGETRPI
jgi:hypothetical protein